MGSRCERCGIDDIRLLDVDHRYGDGKKDRDHFSGAAYYRHLQRNLARVGLLCCNCHRLKTLERYETVRAFDPDDLSDVESLTLFPMDDDAQIK